MTTNENLFKDAITDLNENYFIVRGCTNPNYVGRNQKAEMTLFNFVTPASKRRTGTITVEVYANFDKSSYELTNLIMKQDTYIREEYFVSGLIDKVAFKGQIKFI